VELISSYKGLRSLTLRKRPRVFRGMLGGNPPPVTRSHQLVRVARKRAMISELGRPLAAFQHPNDFGKNEDPTMVGIGSGRSLHVGAASKCEHWRSIDLVDLKRMGLLKPIVDGRIRAISWKNDHGGLDRLGIIPGSAGIRFVKHDAQDKLVGVFVAYTHTPTMFGGFRKWIACPGCRRPTRVLYGINSLWCRRCRGLKYASQSEASHWRAQRKALAIRRRIGASSAVLDGPFPSKPPKMRWATYRRLRAVDAALLDRRLLGATGYLGRLHSRVKQR